MKNQANNSKSIKLYGFGGLLLALNSLILPQTINFNAAVQKAVNPIVEVAEAKTENIVEEVKSELAETEAKATPKQIVYVVVTAYSSTPDQTDDTPFTTANGTRVRDGIIAANFLKFGTKVKFPDHFGDKIFEVTDRMNKRYTNRADIWMETREEALKFGIRTLKMEIY